MSFWGFGSDDEARRKRTAEDAERKRRELAEQTRLDEERRRKRRERDKQISKRRKAKALAIQDRLQSEYEIEAIMNGPQNNSQEGDSESAEWPPKLKRGIGGSGAGYRANLPNDVQDKIKLRLSKEKLEELEEDSRQKFQEEYSGPKINRYF